MKFSPQQDHALTAVSTWLRGRDHPFFYLAGYAGTGKTTLAKHFAEGAGNVLFASFTGKAASVMRSKGCEDATTIHRLIYHSQTRDPSYLKRLQDELRTALSISEQNHLRRLIADEVILIKKPSFRLNRDSIVRDADLVIIDECSMVNGQMADDLLSFNTPVLVLGDPAQLPPVRGEGVFTRDEPDVMLTEVHRQAQESGILRLATQVRQGHRLTYGDYGDARVLERGVLGPDDVMRHDQILVGRNSSRKGTNRRVREILGRKTQLPEQGDRLVCLRNYHDLGLLNGEIWQTLDAAVLDDDLMGLTIRNDDGDALTVDAWRHTFENRDIAFWMRSKEVQEFTYGYALTVHKAQGSEWPSVILFDESYCFRKDAQRHLYTGITRANKQLTVIR